MTANTKFLYDLQALLRKHKASITAADHWLGYAECGQDIRISIEFEEPYEDIEVKYIDVDTLDKLIDQRIINNE